MSTRTNSIEQQATLSQIQGNVQVIRDGFFLPAQAGMALLPGDRVVSDPTGKAVIQFTGVKDALIIEKGAAATFNLEVVELDQSPQWIATDLYGEGVYFDSQATENTAQTSDTPDLFGLFGSPGASSDSTGYPVLESVVALGATAAVFSDNDNNESPSTETATPSESEGGSTPNNPPPSGNPQPEPDTQAGPLDGLLAPVTGVLDSLLGSTALPSAVSTDAAQTGQAQPLQGLNLSALL